MGAVSKNDSPGPCSGVNSLAGTHKRPNAAGNRRIETKLVVSLAVLGVLVALAVAWQFLPLLDLIDLEDLLVRIKRLGHSPVAVAIVLAVYFVGGLVMLPTTLLIFVTVVLFGPVMGFAYATIGCLLNASLSYGLGRLLGGRGFGGFVDRQLDRVTAVLSGREILAVAAVNWAQIVSMTLTGLAAGALGIRFSRFVAGTLIGVAPGILVVAVFEDRLEAAIRDPRFENILILIAITLFGLLATIWAGRRLLRRWTGARRRGPGRLH